MMLKAVRCDASQKDRQQHTICSIAQQDQSKTNDEHDLEHNASHHNESGAAFVVLVSAVLLLARHIFAHSP